MERLERRAIGRVAFPSRGVLVVCDTQEVLHVGVRDLGPIGVGVLAEPETQSLVGKDVIMVAETLIMYADVVRQEPLPDGCWSIGLAARKFSRDVLQYLFDGIEMRAKPVSEQNCSATGFGLYTLADFANDFLFIFLWLAHSSSPPVQAPKTALRS